MVSDLAIALRSLRNNPGFALVAILTLALGIGANTAMFSVVNAVLLRPMPGYDTDRLVIVSDKVRAGGVGLLSPPAFEEVRRQAHSFEQLAAHNFCPYSLTGSGEPEQLIGPCVTANWFDIQGAHAMLGRTFTVGEDEPGRSRVIVLDHAFWQRRFGADRTVIGRRILLNRQPWIIIGVMPPDFHPAFESAIYTPHVLKEDHDTGLWVLGRLKRGISARAAQDEITAINLRMAQSNPDFKTLELHLVSLLEIFTGPQRPLLLLLLGAAGFVLLIACVNVANLFLARGAARQHEIDIRAALGASPARIVRFVLAEAVVISGLAIIASAAIGWAALRLLKPVLAQLPRSGEIGIDTTVLLTTAAIGLFSALLFGIVPALRSARSAGVTSIRTRATAHWQGALVTGEVALAFVLLAGAGLVIRSFVAMRSADVGYDPHNVMTYMISLEPTRDNTRAAGIDLYRRLRESIARVPGIRGVATASSMPMGGVLMQMDVEPVDEPARKHEHQALMDVVSAEYFRVIGIALRAGRMFNETDREGAPLVVMVSDTISKRYFGGHAVGKRIKIPDFRFNLTGDDKELPAEIVGVVADVRVNSIGESGAEHIYFPESQDGLRLTYVVARTDRDPAMLAKGVRRAAYLEAPDTPLDEMRTLESRATYLTEGPRQAMWLLSVFAGLALALAGIGIYGGTAYLAAERRREIGIRMALGADFARIAALIYRGSLLAAGAGLALGIAAAFTLTRFVQSLLHGITPTDPATLAMSGIALAAFALFATTAPALRAATVDPATVLRENIR